MDATPRGPNTVKQSDPDKMPAATSRPSISLVLPAYNEQEVIEQAIQEADDALSALTDDYEVIVVDDGSSDQTRAVAERVAAERPAVRVITYARNQGYGAALRTGFTAATKQWVGFTDADCQFDIREIDRLVLLMRSHDIACGYRIDRQDPWLRCFYSRVYNTMVSAALGTGVRDCDCALKLFRREVLESIPIKTSGFLVNAEVLTKARLAGKSVVEVGVTHRPRPRGTSTVSVWHTIPVLLAMLRFWWSTILFPGTTEPATRTDSTYGQRRQRRWALGLLAAVTLSLFLGRLSYPLIEPDESRYAQIALEMVQSGNYMVPQLHGAPYLDKPPLLYWLTAGSFHLFGATDAAARLPAAVSAILTIFAVFWIGRRLVGEATAYLAAVMLLLCAGFVLAGRFLLMDAVLTTCTTVAVLAAMVAVQSGRRQLGWCMLAGAALALGILTKGPVAPVLIVPPLGIWLWLSRKQQAIGRRHGIAFAGVAIAVAAPWFVWMAAHQPGFVEYFFWKQHVVRYVHTFIHQEPFWYYIPVLAIGMFPASLLLTPLIVFLFSRNAALRRRRSDAVGGAMLVALWTIAFFSISSCKLPTYILPAIPLLCIVQAAALRALLDVHSPIAYYRMLMRQLPAWSAGLAVCIGAGLAIADCWLRDGGTATPSVDIVMITAAVLFAAILVMRRRWLQAGVRSWVVASGVCLVVTAFAFQQFVPTFSEYRSINANAARLQAQIDRDATPVVYLDRPADAATLYLSPRVIRHVRSAQLQRVWDLIESQSPVVVVGDAPHVALLRKELGGTARLVEYGAGRGRVFLLSMRPETPLRMANRPGEQEAGNVQR